MISSILYIIIFIIYILCKKCFIAKNKNSTIGIKNRSDTMGKLKVHGGKKSIVPVIIVISVVIVLVAAIVGCILLLKPSQKTYSGKLSTPENLTVSKTETAAGYQYFVSYSEVEGADRYMIYIDDEYSHSSTSTMVDITKYITRAQPYTISVQAINNRISSYNSDIASVEYLNSLKLETPLVTRTNEIFLWSAVSNADAYNIELSYGNTRNEEQIENSTYDLTRFLVLTQSDPTITSFSFRVQAIYLGNLLWEDSEYSEPAEYHVVKSLGEVHLTHYTEDTTINSNPVTKHKLLWSEVYGADNYEIYLSHNGGMFELVDTVSSDGNFVFDLTTYLNGVGTYAAKVKAVSNNEYTLASISNEVDFVISQKIATPKNVQAVPNGEYMSVSWEPGDNNGLESYYTIIVSNGTSVVHDFSVVGTNYDFLLIVNRAGFYSITITAKNQGQSTLYTDSNPSEAVEVTVVSKLNAPSNITFKQDKADQPSSLTWSAVENATGYAVQLYSLSGDEKLEYGDVHYVSGLSLVLPMTAAGHYFAKVKALVDEGFYQDSDYSNFVECTYKTSLQTPQNLQLNESTLVLSWRAVLNAVSYDVYVGNNPLLTAVFEQDGSTILVTNLAQIFEDAATYPSNDVVPYQISVRAVGEAEGVYDKSEFASVEHYITRQLDAPTNLRYTQTASTNEVTIAWDAVINASNGYCVYINGSAPTILQKVLTTSCEIGGYLLPGYNHIEIVANKSPNYNASDVATFAEDPLFVYYMQPVENVRVSSEVQNGSTFYTLSFDTHKYANYYMFSFYSDENLTQKMGSDHIEAIYYANGESVSFSVDYDCIKRTGDCITYIKVITAYEDGFAGSVAANFDKNFIVGDGQNLLYEKSATSVETYENEALLIAVSNAQVEQSTSTGFTVSFEYITSVINAGRVASFELVLITIDTVSGNSYAVPVYVQTANSTQSSNMGYSKYVYTFNDVAIGQYQVRIRALSANTAKVAHSGSVYVDYNKTIVQETPQNLTIYRSTDVGTYGNVIMQWDAIASVSAQLAATYDACLYAFNEGNGESTLIQEWESVGYSNLTENRGGQVVKILRINLSLARYVGNQAKVVEDFMASGLYYMTVKANALSEFYLESEIATMERANYYQHDAALSPPTIYLSEGSVFIPREENVYYQLYYYTDQDNTLVAMNGLNYTLTLYNTERCFKYSVDAYFSSGFAIGLYHIVAFAKRDIDVNGVITTITSLQSNAVDYSVIYKFDKPELESVGLDYVYNQTQLGYISSLTAVWPLVTAIGVDSQTVVATDYEITISNAKDNYRQKFTIYSLDGTDSYAIKVLVGNNYVTYNYVSKVGGVCTFNYNNKLGFTTQVVESGTKIKFVCYNLDYLTGGKTYTYSVKTLGNELLYYGDSEREDAKSFTYKLMWETPTVAFADDLNNDMATRYIEISNNDSIRLHVNPYVGANQTFTGDWTFNILITNVETGRTLGFARFSGINVAGVVGRVCAINASAMVDENKKPLAGLYKIEVKIDQLQKCESPASIPLYVYYSLKNDSPKITKVAKASTFYGNTDVNNIAMEWAYTGFDGIDNADLSFTVSITETNEDGTVTAGGFSASTIVLKSGLNYANGKYSTVISLSSFANANDFFWSKNWGVAETVTHYTFAVVANAYSTSLTSVYNALVDAGENEASITPSSSAKYTALGKKYEFHENSDAIGYLVRRDSSLAVPTNLELSVVNDTKTISWENVSDPASADYEVGYKYVYYTITSDNKYYLHLNDGSEPFQVVFSGARVLKYSDSTEISFLKNASNFWFSTENNYFEVTTNVATIFGVWIFAEPLDSGSTSSASNITFGIVSYTKLVSLPEQMYWETTQDNTTNSIYFENAAYSQLPGATVNTYKQLYSISVGGHDIDWVNDAASLGAITANSEQFKVVISGLYNNNAFTENVNEFGATIERQYAFTIVANNYSMNVYNPLTATNQNILLYETNSVNGVVYKPIIIQRTVADATITTNDGLYYATWQEISSATKYEMIFVDATNTPIGTDTRYFVHNTIPSNYVAKISVEIGMNSELSTWVVEGSTQMGYIVVEGSGLRNITVDFTALLNSRPAATYYLAIYTIADVEKYITPANDVTTATKSFEYQKQYQAVDAESFIFTTDEEGLLKTISWSEEANPDGGWVHDNAYYRFTIWDTNHSESNPVLYVLDGSDHRYASLSVSESSGVSSLTNLITSPVFTFVNSDTLGPRMVFDVETLFINYLRKDGVRHAGSYTLGIQIYPVNAAASSYQPSLTTTVDFVYKVKLEFDESTNYVSVMVDSCLNTTTAATTHEIEFKDTDSRLKAEEYLAKQIIADNFNMKSLYIDNWLPASQSVTVAVYTKIDGRWTQCGQIADVLTNQMLILSGGQINLVPGENKIAIKAIGINENYVTSEFREITFNLYYKHITPTISLDTENIQYTDDGQTLTHIFLKLSNVGTQDYDVVINAYRVIDGENVLAFTTPTAAANRITWLGSEGRFAYKSTYEVVEKRNQTVNFMDWFRAFAGTIYGNTSYENYEMYSLIGAYDYVFTARIYASTTEPYMLNSDESQPTNTLSYTYKIATPNFATTLNGENEEIKEFITRDADDQITSVKLKIRIDNPGFKTIIDYSINVWDLDDSSNRYVLNGNDTVRYTAKIAVMFNEQNEVSYSIVGVSYMAHSDAAQVVSSANYSRYFEINDGYLEFELINFIKNDLRENNYLAGKYRYNVRADMGSNYYTESSHYTLMQNQNIITSNYAFDTESEVEDAPYDMFYEYIHRVPYPVAISAARVTENGVLEITWQDRYQAAMAFDIYVNDIQTVLLLEEANNNTQRIYSLNISNLLIPGLPNVVKVNVQAIGYYYSGKQITATLDFVTWTHEVVTIKNLAWSSNSGTHELSFDAEFYELYKNDNRLSKNGQPADRVHFALQILYLSSFDTTLVSGLEADEIYELFSQQDGVDSVYIADLSSFAEFVPETRVSYRFDINKCIQSVREEWVVNGSVRGGYYAVKLIGTVANLDGTYEVGTECFLDSIAYIPCKYVLSPWQLSGSAAFWDELGNGLIWSTQTATEQQKQVWADNETERWGVSFNVSSVSNTLPSEYKVYYFRDTRENAFDDMYSFTVSGVNVEYDENTVWLNFQPYFNASTVPYAGIYSFAIKALAVEGVASESAYIGLLSATGVEIANEAIQNYTSHGLKHFVRLAIPVLDNELYDQRAQEARIRISSGLSIVETEENLTELYVLENFRSLGLEDGQAYPENLERVGMDSFSDSTLVYHERTRNDLALQHGDNFVSAQSTPQGALSEFYLNSLHSNLKHYIWDVSLEAPTSVEIGLTEFTSGYKDDWQGTNSRTVPENMDANLSGQDGTHTNGGTGVYNQNVGGVRSQSAQYDTDNSVSYQDYITISTHLSAADNLIDGVTHVEIRVFDPVTNETKNENYVLAYFFIRVDTTTGFCYLERMANPGTNALVNYNELIDMQNKVVGTNYIDGGSVVVLVTGLKIYQLFPTIEYRDVWVRADKNDIGAVELYSGIKDYANIPQTYLFGINSYSGGVYSGVAYVDYDYTLRLLTPQIAENGIEFNGDAIATKGGSVYIKDATNPYAYDITFTINNISRTTSWIKLYVYVDETGQREYYADENDTYYANTTANYGTLNERACFYQIFDISTLVEFENENSLYGTAEIVVDASHPMWQFINNNSPNVFAFHVQAISRNGDYLEYVMHEGCLYLYENTTNNERSIETMQLRYSESYISAKQTFTLKRQFVAAPIDLRFDYGQFAEGETVTGLEDQSETQIINNNISNLHVTSDVALDPYIVMHGNSYGLNINYTNNSATPHTSILPYEYEETQKYGAYEVEITCDGRKSSKKIFTTKYDEETGKMDLGLFDIVGKYDTAAADNPARYYFENDTYHDKPILSEYSLYNLFASVCPELQGGLCTIKIRAVTSQNTKWGNAGNITNLKENLWVSQDDTKWTERVVDFYARPNAVKLTLSSAVFDENNPRSVYWDGTDENHYSSGENEVLYPNTVMLDWTTSGNFGSYTIDITRSIESIENYGSQGFVINKNQGTDRFVGNSLNIADPFTNSAFGFKDAEGGNYNTSKNTYARFNYWDRLNKDTSDRTNNVENTSYMIVIQPNGNTAQHVGKGWRSGAVDGDTIGDATYYYMQLKYNMGSFTACESEWKLKDPTPGSNSEIVTLYNGGNTEVYKAYDINNFSKLEFTTKDMAQGGNESTITLAQEQNNEKAYNYVKRTYVTLSGVFTNTKNDKGEYVGEEETKDLLYATNQNKWDDESCVTPYITGFSLVELRRAILNYLIHIDAIGGEYTFQLYFASGDPDEDQDSNMIPFIKSETSGIFKFKYYRAVEDSGLTITNVEDVQENNQQTQASTETEDTEENEEEESEVPTATYGLKFAPNKNLEAYEKYVGEYSIAMLQIGPSNSTSTTSTPMTIGEQEYVSYNKATDVLKFVSYNTIGCIEDGEQGAALATAYAVQAFDEEKADALDSKRIDSDEVKNYTQKGYTNNLGSLQGGKNYYLYTITAGDAKYNLPVRNCVSYNYKIPTEYMPHINTLADSAYKFVDELNLELIDYYSNGPTTGNVTINPKTTLYGGANYDLFYTQHSVGVTGFPKAADIVYSNAYTIEWTFEYEKIKIDKVNEKIGKETFAYDKYSKEPTTKKNGTASKQGSDKGIVFTEANGVCVDAENEDVFKIDFTKENQKIINEKTGQVTQTYAYQIKNFTFTIKCKPGFADVFKTTVSEHWYNGNNGEEKGTIKREFDDYSAKVASKTSQNIKFATINVRHVVGKGASTNLTLNIGKGEVKTFGTKTYVETMYYAVPQYKYRISNITESLTYRSSHSWKKERYNKYSGELTGRWEYEGRGYETVYDQQIEPLSVNGFYTIDKISTSVSNTTDVIKRRPEDHGIGWYTEWGAERFSEEEAVISIESAIARFEIIGKELRFDDPDIPLNHTSSWLMSKNSTFGFDVLPDVNEMESVCDKCSGTTYKTCDKCSGSGYYHYADKYDCCDKCLGTGKMPCTDCSSGYQEKCSICAGATLITCKRCGGQGYLEFTMKTNKYMDGDEEKSIGSADSSKWFRQKGNYVIGCPDCGGSGVKYDGWLSSYSKGNMKYIYYDVNSGKLIKGSSEISTNNRKKDITKGTGYVKCYSCSGGSKQGTYDEHGVPITSSPAAANTPAAANMPETAELVYAPYVCDSCDFCDGHCHAEDCDDCEHDTVSNSMTNQPEAKEEQTTISPLQQSIVEKQIETNGQPQPQNDTPLQNAENIMLQASCKEVDDMFLTSGLPINVETCG